MYSQTAAIAGGLSTAVFVFLCVLALLWFFLPFAVFGTKPKLDEINDNLKETNRLLKTLLEAGQPRQQAAPPPALPPPPPRPEPLPPSWLPPPPRTEQGTRREPPDLPSFRPQWQDDRLR